MMKKEHSVAPFFMADIKPLVFCNQQIFQAPSKHHQIFKINIYFYRRIPIFWDIQDHSNAAK